MCFYVCCIHKILSFYYSCSRCLHNAVHGWSKAFYLKTSMTQLKTNMATIEYCLVRCLGVQLFLIVSVSPKYYNM